MEVPRLYTTVPIGDLVRARYTADRLSLPLEQNLFVRFKHVTGVPSATGEGFSVSKLQLVDTLIEVLKNLQQGQSVPLPSKDSLSAEGIDPVIQNLAKEVHRKLVSLSQTPFAPALGAGKGAVGILLNLST